MKKLAIVIAVALPVIALADPEALDTLFPQRAQITAEGTGLCRLDLSAEVIGACRADLADVRILAHDGREIPYIVDSPEPVGVTTTVSYDAALEIIDTTRSRERIADVNVYRESFMLGLPALPAEVPAWDLVFAVGAPEFVSRLDLTAVGPDGQRTQIVTEGSLFRLPSADAERLRFTIGVRDAVRLELAIETQDVGFLEPRFEVEASRFLPELGSSSVALEILETRNLGRATEVVVSRPRGLLPRRLSVTTATDTFHRRITVWDEGPGADPEPLGTGAVLRVAAIAPVEVLEILLRPPRGDRLRLIIENQDSPPLEKLAIAAQMPRPVLVFSLPDGPPSATLYFGGGRAHRPHYDLAALDPQRRLAAHGETAEQAIAVLDPALAHRASLGALEPNPGFDPAPVLGFAIHPGADLDPGPFSHRRHLRISPSPEGLAKIELEPADLAVLRSDLADLRIADPDGRQWAYLRQDAARTVGTPLEVVGHEIEDRVSRYEIPIPNGPLVVTRLDLEVGAPYFDRDFVLTGLCEDDGRPVLAVGSLVRRAGDPRPSTIAVTPSRVIGLELKVTDGDDAPLAFGRVEARSTAPDLYLAAAPGEYDLLLGFPDTASPVYELERVRSAILAVPASKAVAGDLESNPDFDASTRIYTSGRIQKLILWGALGLAVVVLVVLTLRAARQEGGP